MRTTSCVKLPKPLGLPQDTEKEEDALLHRVKIDCSYDFKLGHYPRCVGAGGEVRVQVGLLKQLLLLFRWTAIQSQHWLLKRQPEREREIDRERKLVFYTQQREREKELKKLI